MTRYRMRPVEKEAWRIRDVLESTRASIDPKVLQALTDGVVTPDGSGIAVRTAEGTMRASEDDYLVLGVNNEWYPVMRSVFEKSYEPVEVSS